MQQDKKENRFRAGSKAWFQDHLAPFRAFGEIFLLAAAIFGLFCLLCLIFIEADVLGKLFLPVLFGYLALLILAAAVLLHRKQKQAFRAQVGEQIYFETFPREYRRKLRRERREEKRQAEREHPKKH